LLSEVPFAAALVYSPRGTSEESRKSRELVRDPVKRADAEFLRGISEHLRRFLPADIVADFLAEDVVLVPAPRRAPLPSKDALWPALLLSRALVAGGMGARVLPCITRTEAVPKSAFAGPGGRPLPERHYETMRVRPGLDQPAKITIVDDIVTKGATLIAAASRVVEAFPGAQVRVFALVRTMGLVAEIERMGAPCRGLITFDGHDADRRP